VAAAGLLIVVTACSSGAGSRTNPVPPPSAAPPTTTVAAAAETASGYGPPVLLGTVDDPDVTESSGLVASRRNPGLYWTHNDSGDGPFLYCLDGHGSSCGAWRVTGADAIDWEDIAAGPGPDPSTPYLYVGDIGDNLGDRPDVVVYRVPEPAVDRSAPPPAKASPGRTQPAQALTLRYPDGSHDAEALLVQPRTGDVYIVAKEPNPGVYVARAPVDPAATTTLQKVATLPLGTGGLFTLVTGGDIAPDGRRLALCTYGPGYELRLPDGAQSFDAIWRQPPVPLTLGARPQGEGIAYRLDGKALLTTSERPAGLADPLQQIERQ
jgi:hypothetical protein